LRNFALTSDGRSVWPFSFASAFPSPCPSPFPPAFPSALPSLLLSPASSSAVFPLARVGFGVTVRLGAFAGVLLRLTASSSPMMNSGGSKSAGSGPLEAGSLVGAGALIPGSPLLRRGVPGLELLPLAVPRAPEAAWRATRLAEAVERGGVCWTVRWRACSSAMKLSMPFLRFCRGVSRGWWKRWGKTYSPHGEVWPVKGAQGGHGKG
jgi:hypothetical protein